MDEASEQRMAENEVMFRHANTKNKGRQRRADHATDETIVNFFCECSNRNCHERIPVSIKDYEKVHKSNKHFIVLIGHENPAIEQVVKREGAFNVIQKYADPSKEVD